MSILLALDASSSACSCALWRDGEVLSRFALTPREHTRRLMPMIDEVLAEAGLAPADLDAVVYGRGPGSFTGLRIAAGVAQGLAFGLDRPLVGVSTLEALALAGYRQHRMNRVVTALDARMGEIYVGAYRCEEGGVTPLMDEAVMPPARLRLPDGDSAWNSAWGALGSGWSLRDAMPESVRAAITHCISDIHPAADDIVRLAAEAFARGAGAPAAEVTPIYLRDRVAHKRG